jgi:hypothetical protein
MQWLIFGIIGAVVAFGIHRLSRERREEAFAAARQKEALTAQEMVQCSICQAYVVKGAAHCGRDDCPHPKKAIE